MTLTGSPFSAKGGPLGLRLVLDIDQRAEPVQGWLEQPARRVPFTGLLELLVALEQALDEHDPAP